MKSAKINFEINIEENKMCEETIGISSPYESDTNKYLWDWCQDMYKLTSGEFLAEVEITKDEVSSYIKSGLLSQLNDDTQEFYESDITKFFGQYVPYTRDILSVIMNNDEMGCTVLNHVKWEHIEW